MPDGFVFPWDEPYPDQIVEALRLRMLASIANLDTHTAQLDGALLLIQTSLDFAQTFLDAVTPLQQQVIEQAAQIATQQQTLDDLAARVAALEQPPTP